MAGEKKKIFEIELPSIRQKVPAFAASQDSLVGKFIKMDMTRQMKGKNVDATFVISNNNGALEGNFVSLHLLPAFIKRMIRKGISWIEDSFVCQAKDAKLQVKPFMITRKKIHRKVRAELRSRARELITKFVSEKNSQDVFSAIFHSELQKELSHSLRKIYPLSLCEIRICKIVK